MRLLSARTEDKRIESIELSPETYKVAQIRGICNQNTKYYEQIMNLVYKISALVATAVNIAEVYTKFHIGQYTVIPIDLRTDGNTCHSVLLLNILRRVPFGQVGIHLIFGKGGIYMFFAVIIELADSHLRHFVLPCKALSTHVN